MLADHWWWLIAGLLLAGAEMLAPGVFLIWIGAAALLTGVLTLASGIALPLQLGIFAVSAVGAIYGAQRWLTGAAPEPEDPLLNDRVARLTGELVTVSEAIAHGRGRVRVADGEWPATGPDAPAGARMRVIGGHDGRLVVEPLPTLER